MNKTAIEEYTCAHCGAKNKVVFDFKLPKGKDNWYGNGWVERGVYCDGESGGCSELNFVRISYRVKIDCSATSIKVGKVTFSDAVENDLRTAILDGIGIEGRNLLLKTLLGECEICERFLREDGFCVYCDREPDFKGGKS